MPRSRSGSFYCPLEPALPPLSIAQKAAISTAPAPSSSPCLSSSRQSSSSSPLRRHVRSPSFDGADGPASVTLPAAKLETTTIGTTEPLSLRNKSSIVNPKRYPWSPAKPSPLRRQTNAASSSPSPMCASALYQDLLLPSLQLHKSSSRARTPSSMRQSVIRHAFMSSPMGEKTQLYGLRVAWCVFGDVKEQLAKDIFVHGTQAGYHHPASTTTVVEEDAHVTEHVEVVVSSSQSDALSPPPPLLRSRLRRERSFVWDVQGPLVTPDQLSTAAAAADKHVNANVVAELSDSDTESEYSDEDEEDTSDTETESAESEEDDDDDLEFELDDIELSLDDEEEVQRDILALLHSHSTGITNPNPSVGGKVLDGEAHWDMMPFEL